MKLFTLLLLAVSLQAATYYVDDAGDNGNGGSSCVDAWATFAYADGQVSAGDTVRICDGTYTEQLCPTTVGSSGNPITYQAVNDGAVAINGGGTHTPIQIGGDCASHAAISYIDIEGIVAYNGTTGAVVSRGASISFRRVSAYNANTDGNNIVFYLISATDNLVEDCVMGGSGRKMALSWHSNVDEPRRHIFRRNVAMWLEFQGADFDPGNWPWGDSMEAYGSSSVIFENNITLGVAPGPRPGIGSNNQQSGKTLTDLGIYGNMTIQAGRTLAGIADMSWPCPSPYRTPEPGCTDFPGVYRTGIMLDAIADAMSGIDIRDHLSYGNGGDGIFIQMATSTNFSLTRATVANNALASDENGVDMTAGTIAHFDTISDSYIEGTAYQDGGANLVYRYESGFTNDVPVPNLTGTPLWPWPMEGRINSEFATYLYPTWGTDHPDLADFSVTSKMQGIFDTLGDQNPNPGGTIVRSRRVSGSAVFSGGVR